MDCLPDRSYIERMARKASSLHDISCALPAAQEAVRAEIAARIAAGEFIARVEDDRIIASEPVARDLAAERRALVEAHAARATERDRAERKSVA